MAENSLKLRKSPGHDLDGSGAVEITGLPHILQTKTFAHPDVLFVPLVECAREALAAGTQISGDAGDKKQASKLAGMHISGFLFRDSNFTPAAKGFAHPNYYIVDLDEETIDLHTRLFASVKNRCSMFRVKITGNLRQGIYVVRNLADGSTVGEITDEQALAPNFFADTLAEECLRMQLSREHAKQISKMQNGFDAEEMHLKIPMVEGPAPVVLRKCSTGFGWLLFDASTGLELGKVAPDTVSALGRVMQALATLVNEKRVASGSSKKPNLPEASTAVPSKPAVGSSGKPAAQVLEGSMPAKSRG